MSEPYPSIFRGSEVDAGITKINKFEAGKVTLANGISAGSVTGLDLEFTPAFVILTVAVPDESLFLLMFAAAAKDSLSADGFDYFLSGQTDLATYELHYLLIGS